MKLQGFRPVGACNPLVLAVLLVCAPVVLLVCAPAVLLVYLKLGRDRTSAGDAAHLGSLLSSLLDVADTRLLVVAGNWEVQKSGVGGGDNG